MFKLDLAIGAVLVLSLLALGSQASPTGRIVGGSDAYTGQFPHQISLRWRGQHICGGSIISNNYVLTAAHCVGDFNENGTYIVDPAEDFSIRAGTLNRFSGGVVVNVVKVITHESYGDFVNDMALLQLEKPLIYSANIRAIPLASAEVPVGSKVTISGWGLTRDSGHVPATLQWTQVEALSKTRCFSSILMFTDALICLAHPEGIGACQGDSGGPAIYNGEIVGVAGFVVGGCGSTNPDGYNKVFYHLDWIRKNAKM